LTWNSATQLCLRKEGTEGGTKGRKQKEKGKKLRKKGPGLGTSLIGELLPNGKERVQMKETPRLKKDKKKGSNLRL